MKESIGKYVGEKGKVLLGECSFLNQSEGVQCAKVGGGVIEYGGNDARGDADGPIICTYNNERGKQTEREIHRQGQREK